LRERPDLGSIAERWSGRSRQLAGHRRAPVGCSRAHAMIRGQRPTWRARSWPA